MYDSTIDGTIDGTIGGRVNDRPTDWPGRIRLVFGTVLILAGIALAIWLAITIHGLIWGEGVPAVVANLTPQSQEDVAIILPDGEYVLAHKVFPVIAYVLTVFLLMVAVALVKAMIKGGTALLPTPPALPPPIETPAQYNEERAALEAHYDRGPL